MTTLSSNVLNRSAGQFSEVSGRREFLKTAGTGAEPKGLVYVPGAGHVDLYDRVPLIPFDKLNAFFTRHLVQASA